MVMAKCGNCRRLIFGDAVTAKRFVYINRLDVAVKL